MTAASDTQHHFDIATHNGQITMTNPKTGEHRTIKIKTQPKDSDFAPGERVAYLLVGPDNGNDYKGFAFVSDKGRVNVWRRHSESRAFRAFASMLEDPAKWSENHGIEYLYSGTCRVCNRTLTHPESIETGIGPVCAGRE